MRNVAFFRSCFLACLVLAISARYAAGQVPDAPKQVRDHIKVGPGATAMTFDPAGKFMYVPNGNLISIFAIDESTGVLHPVGKPVSVIPPGATNPKPYERPFCIVFDPAGKFAFVASVGGAISTFAVDARTGLLVPSGKPAEPYTKKVKYSFGEAGLTVPVSLAVDPSGNFVYVVCTDNTVILTYRVEPSNGTLSLVHAVAGGGTRLLLQPHGKFGYLAMNAGYRVDSTSGELTPCPWSWTMISDPALYSAVNPPGYAVGYAPNYSAGYSVVFDPAGKYAYVIGSRKKDKNAKLAVFTFDSDTGRPTLAGQPANLPPAPQSQSQPVDLVVSPNGRFLYVADSAGGGDMFHRAGTVHVFAVSSNGTAPALVRSLPVQDAQPNSLAIGGGGRFLYLLSTYGNVLEGRIDSFAINPTTGELQSVEAMTALVDPFAPAKGTGTTVKDGVLTYKDPATGDPVSLKVARPALLPPQMIPADSPNAGPWIWISDDGTQGKVITVQADGSVTVQMIPGFVAGKMLGR